ncbi:trehalose synthase [Candidatus Kuenenia stuttgartiensis]|uniref:Trehalose synthase n=1 Tax=Kuenenia stuttgartiensis TaxID=174633 RepID=A0A6G7GT72_KUEST|nr:glycosyltransferase [Candidatus Kuenenia stuttgartiensis]QII12562.1 trehalose synthase [Candidatus Kuenenia stuttgartiensis]
MLEKVVLKKKRIDDYAPVIGQEKVAYLKEVAKPIQGLRVLHVNATAHGGGVAELLNSTIPLLNSLGLQAEWGLLCKEEPFFEVTKNFHNALQGKYYNLTPLAEKIYLKRNRLCAEMLESGYDLIMIHDPQPASLRRFHGRGNAKWIWRCHIDTSRPNMDIWNFIKPFIEEYDATVFTMKEFVPWNIKAGCLYTIAPAIDPFTSKNIDLDIAVCKTIVAEFGIDLSRPLLLQVSRFDLWKDPLGVLEVYRRVKEKVAGIQLAYIGSMADDDPEGWEIYHKVKEQAKDDPDIFLYTNLSGVHSFEVNCFQRVADVVIQKSIREGFGLVVSEALWKGAAVVAGNVGGIPLQINDGVNGLLAQNNEEFVEKVLYLLTNKKERHEMGKRGHDDVREHFLVTRLVREEIEMYRELIQKPVSNGKAMRLL